MKNTHWLIVNRDSTPPNWEVLGWFPKSEDGAEARARRMAKDTGDKLAEGFWDETKGAFKVTMVDGPEALKELFRF